MVDKLGVLGAMIGRLFEDQNDRSTGDKILLLVYKERFKLGNLGHAAIKAEPFRNYPHRLLVN